LVFLVSYFIVILKNFSIAFYAQFTIFIFVFMITYYTPLTFLSIFTKIFYDG